MPRNRNYEHYIEQLRNFIRCCYCQKDCHPNPIACDICNKKYHNACLRLMNRKNHTDPFVVNNCAIICNNKCYGTFLPFKDLSENEVISLYYGNGKNPCKYCKADCVENMTACTRCYTCNRSVHIACIKKYDPQIYFTCGPKCEMLALPFSTSRDQELFQFDIFARQLKVQNQSTSANSTQSSETNDQSKKKNVPNPKDFVKIDHFLNLKCGHVDPNKVDDDLLSSDESDISIFHNNICSLNTNFHKVDEIFQKCKSYPDVLAFSETRLNSTTSNPDLQGYNFEAVHSPTSAGGVGIYISNKMNYSIKNDMSLNAEGCEDLWVDVDTKHNEGQSNNTNKNLL